MPQPPKRTVDVPNLKRLRKSRLGEPPSVEEASTNLSAPEFAPGAPLQLVTESESNAEESEENSSAEDTGAPSKKKPRHSSLTNADESEENSSAEDPEAPSKRKPKKAVQPAKVRALVVTLRDRQADEKTADERLRPRAHSVPLSLHIPARLDTRLREFAMAHKLRLGEVIEIAMDALEQHIR